MLTIIHPHADLDACACVWASLAIDVHFLPAHLRAMPEICPCCGEDFTKRGTPRILDHPLGEKGRLEADGQRRAALLSMPEADGIEPRLLAEIDEQDSTGTVQAPRFSLGELLAGLRQEGIERGLSGKALDLDLLETMRRVFQGIQLRHESRQEADAWIEEHVQIHEIGAWRFASCALDLPPTVGEVLNDAGVSGSIYGGEEARKAGAKDWNIGVFRFPGRETPDLRSLSPRLPGYFIHSAGFLAAWGSRKAPQQSPPPEGEGPRSQAGLIAIMREVLG